MKGVPASLNAAASTSTVVVIRKPPDRFSRLLSNGAHHDRSAAGLQEAVDEVAGAGMLDPPGARF
jgi:hypothetical protein